MGSNGSNVFEKASDIKTQFSDTKGQIGLINGMLHGLLLEF